MNEKFVILLCCYGNIICGFDKFLSCFKEIVDSCDFDVLCFLFFIENFKVLVVILSFLFLFMLLLFIFVLFFKDFMMVVRSL